VLLRLEGPLQSWGTQGRFGIRDTDTEPSKSGVIGIVGAGLGMPRGDDVMLARLAAMSMAVRVDRSGTVVRDYHTVGGGNFAGRPHGLWGSRDPAITERFYLADASFLAALGGEDDGFVDAIAAALQRPKWPLFLGRRACAPSRPVFAGVMDAHPAEAVRRAPIGSDAPNESPRVRVVIECEEGAGSLRNDVPKRFAMYDRRHGVRYVTYEYVNRSDLPMEA
jgi:CRISPR system Cascade subunit CasD